MDVPIAVWNAYPAEYRWMPIRFLDSAGGFSGAKFWRLSAEHGDLLLRRWPREHPDPLRLQYVHAVLAHARSQGFERIPRHIGTQCGETFVCEEDHLWELTTWLPGKPNLATKADPRTLQNAMRAVAAFHLAVADYRSSAPNKAQSPGLTERAERLTYYQNRGLQELASCIRQAEASSSIDSAVTKLAWQLLVLFERVAGPVSQTLNLALQIETRMQPCIRDLRPEHILFEGSSVSGFVDFGSLRVDNVTTDLARLLGDIAADEASQWNLALNAYQELRRLSSEEQQLLLAFDQSAVALGGLTWLEWIYRQKRKFPDSKPIQTRLKHYIGRLSYLLETAFGSKGLFIV